jgi:hypothetical protein
VRAHEATTGLAPADWPSVGVPRPAALAPGAALLAERDDGLPALAAGRAGLGRVVEWTPPGDDAGTLAWPLWPRLLAQTARSLVPPAPESDVPVARVVPGKDGDELRVSRPDGPGLPWTVEADFGEGPVPATPSGRDDGDAVWKLPDAPDPTRPAVVRARASDVNLEPQRPMPAPVTYLPRGGVPYPTGSDPAAIEAALGTAPLATGDPRLFEVEGRARDSERSLVPWCLLAFALLLPLDVFLHRRGKRA